MKKSLSNVLDINSTARAKLNDEVDDLFKLPLAEFTDARNVLAKRLKQSGRATDADYVKTLTKPSVSAWTVNQLYWQHRDEFEALLEAGQRVRQAQISGAANKLADMRQALDARRESLTELSDVATSLLQESGHNPSPDTVRRITTTLEALSALELFTDDLTLGRLTQDVDPPGFESFASFMPGAGAVSTALQQRVATTKSKSNTTTARDEVRHSARDSKRLEEARQARIAAAKSSLQAAKKSLAVARAKAQRLEAAQKKADAEVTQAEKQLREAEARFKKASAAAEGATERAQSIAAEVEEAANAVADAETVVEEASNELESLFGRS